MLYTFTVYLETIPENTAKNWREKKSAITVLKIVGILSYKLM